MAAESEDQGVMRIGKRCYVGNLAWKTSWQDLKDKFRACGTVVYANVMRDDTGRSKGWGIVEFETPEEAVAAVNAFNGVEMAGRKMLVREDREDHDVKQYNRENGLEVEPRPRPPRRERRRATPVTAEGGEVPPEAEAGAPQPQPQPQPQQQRAPRTRAPRPEQQGQSSGLQVVVQGLPWKYTEEDLQQLLAECGTIAHAEVVYSRDGRSRGYGLVRFETAEQADAAMKQFHGTEVEGRTLTIKLDKFA